MQNSNSSSDNFWDKLDLDKLSYEELTELSKKVSPFYKKNGKTEKQEWFAFSIFNLREKYMERLLMTSLIAYMFRCADEYNGNKEEARKFCEHIFRFDPNRHLASAKSNVIELKDEEVNEIAKDIKFEDVHTAAQSVHQCSNIVKYETQNILNYLKDARNTPLDKVQERIIKTNESLNDMLKTVSKLARPKTSMMALSDKPVPGEIFHGFSRYYQANYEELRKITETVYPDRADLEYSIQFYRSFKSEEDAREYVRVNQDDFDFDIIVTSNNGVTVLGPFRKNKASMDYYNKNSDILKKIMDQNLKDQKIGADLMKNRVYKDKSANIEKFGNDPKKLEEWKKLKEDIDGVIHDDKKRQDAVERMKMLEAEDDENVIPVHRQNKDGKLETKYVNTDVSDDKTYAHVNK